jgi:hypothetical protein
VGGGKIQQETSLVPKQTIWPRGAIYKQQDSSVGYRTDTFIYTVYCKLNIFTSTILNICSFLVFGFVKVAAVHNAITELLCKYLFITNIYCIKTLTKVALLFFTPDGPV